MAVFRQLSGFAIDLARRSERELEGNRIVEVLADENLGVDLLELDGPIAGDLELFGDHAGIRHRERAGAAALRILAGRWQKAPSLAEPSQGLSLMPRHTIIVMIPPGFRLFRTLRRPATGFSKNCVPKREKQKSYTGSNG